jgi:hypothetical protein
MQRYEGAVTAKSAVSYAQNTNPSQCPVKAQNAANHMDRHHSHLPHARYAHGRLGPHSTPDKAQAPPPTTCVVTEGADKNPAQAQVSAPRPGPLGL